MFQNRVDPFGNIIIIPERGSWTGNRGVLHNLEQKIIRAYKTKAWITCALNFRGRHREIMQPNRWTELFFLDEATAFSAGHRPCFQCRYKDHQNFKNFWIHGNPQYGFNMSTPISKIDAILHDERIATNNTKVLFEENLLNIPDGAFVSYNSHAFLVKEMKMYQWTAGGYKGPISPPVIDKLQILTPRSIVNAFIAGYIPQTAMGVTNIDYFPK